MFVQGSEDINLSPSIRNIISQKTLMMQGVSNFLSTSRSEYAFKNSSSVTFFFKSLYDLNTI